MRLNEYLTFQADTNVVAMCVEYCRTTKYLSPIVMDTAADHFTQHGMSYEPLQLFAVLRVFGHLNYLPADSAAFLKQVLISFPNLSNKRNV